MTTGVVLGLIALLVVIVGLMGYLWSTPAPPSPPVTFGIAAPLYQALGKEAGVSLMVSTLYIKVVSDPVLAHYFLDVDIAKLVHNQTAMFRSIVGGGGDVSHLDHRTIHRHLNISDADVDRLFVIAGEVFDLFGVDPEVKATVVQSLEHFRSDVKGS